MNFSKQNSKCPTLRWIEAKNVLNKYKSKYENQKRQSTSKRLNNKLPNRRRSKSNKAKSIRSRKSISKNSNSHNSYRRTSTSKHSHKSNGYHSHSQSPSPFAQIHHNNIRQSPSISHVSHSHGHQSQQSQSIGGIHHQHQAMKNSISQQIPIQHIMMHQQPRNSMTNGKIEMQTSMSHINTRDLIEMDSTTDTDSENSDDTGDQQIDHRLLGISNINTCNVDNNNAHRIYHNYGHHMDNDHEEYLFSPPSQHQLMKQSMSFSNKHSMNSFPFTRGILPRQTTYDQIRKDLELRHYDDVDDMDNNGGNSCNPISDCSELEGVDDDDHNQGQQGINMNNMNRNINVVKGGNVDGNEQKRNENSHNSHSEQYEEANRDSTTAQPPTLPFNEYHNQSSADDTNNEDNLTVNILTTDDEEEDEEEEKKEVDIENNGLSLKLTKLKVTDNSYKNEYEESPLIDIGDEDSLSTVITIPANPLALQHQTETISDISIFDNIHELDPQDIDDDGSVFNKYTNYTKYDGYQVMSGISRAMMHHPPPPQHNNMNVNINMNMNMNINNNTNDNHDKINSMTQTMGTSSYNNPSQLIITTSDSSSFDSGHANLAEPSSSDQLMNANNNMSNNDDSDLIQSGHSNFQSGDMGSIENHRSDSALTSTTNSHNRINSGCPVYMQQDSERINTDPIHSKHEDMICIEERNVFKSLQHKLLQTHDYKQNYLGLRSEYLWRKNKIKKDRRINLNRTKERIHETFNEMIQLIKERENVLLFELDELYESQRRVNVDIDEREENDNREIQKLVTQHIQSISRKINDYNSITNPNINSSTKS